MDKSMVSSDFNSPPESSLPEFVKPIDDKHLCAKCCQLLRPPVKQSLCGHRMCSRCVEEMFDGVEEVECPGQEEDCIPLRKDKLNPDQAANKELQRLEVYCSNIRHGCQQKVKWGKLNEHLKICPYRTIKCPNIGCNAEILEKDLDKHISECDYTLEHCSVCDKDISILQMRSGHVNECIVKPRKCLLEPLGCTFEAPSNAHEKHLLPCVVNHGKEITKTVRKYKTEQEELKDKIQTLEQSFGDLQKTVDSLNINSQSEETIRELNTQVAMVNDNLATLKQKVDQCATKTQLQLCTDELQQVKTAANAQESRLSHLEQTGRMGPSGGGGVNRDIVEKVGRLENSVGLHDIRIAESDLRFRLLETAAFNGNLIWRIPQYSRRKEDAIEARTLSLYSQPFYSSYFGYKMCARVYLNGDGLGKGSHLSFFFVIMRGEYDPLLPWPFRQRVTLTLLDQSGNRKHITDTFRPDPTSSSFRRPVGEMNIASGSPLFAPHAKVEAEPFLKEDTIFLCITLDKTDMPEPWS